MTEAAASGPPAGDDSLRGLSGPLRLLSDERLARRAAKGERRAFEAIYRRYHEDLYRFCLATTGNPQDAQDALQNTMVKVLRALPGEERRIQLRPWLYRIARNEAVETIRRRHDTAELAPEQAPAPLEIAATAESRERLRGLLADLEELPERQRAALVMREMAGLGFEQIGDSLGASAQAARQTVYEARLGLRQMEAGREMDCDAVMRELSDADGRVARRRELRAHLRVCESCRAFRAGIAERRGGFAGIAPLPLAASAGLLQSALGAGAAGTAVATSAVVKSAATVAVVAVVGAAAADRGGLIDAPVPGGGSSSAPAEEAPRPVGAPLQGGEADSPTRVTPPAKSAKPRPGNAGKEISSGAPGRDVTVAGSPDATPDALRGRGSDIEFPRGHGRHRGRPDGLPPASKHGQETAAAHKAPQGQASPGPGGAAERGGGGSAAKPASPPPAHKPPSPEQKAATPPQKTSPPGVPKIAPSAADGSGMPPTGGKKPAP